jgi:hypothetical protein
MQTLPFDAVNLPGNASDFSASTSVLATHNNRGVPLSSLSTLRYALADMALPKSYTRELRTLLSFLINFENE